MENKITIHDNELPDLSMHIPKISDRTWLEHYISKMGEKQFFEYKDKVYVRLYMLKLGETLLIPQWCKQENFDLFVKIAFCFITEHPTYRFENKYNAITHKYDAREMEELRQISNRLIERWKNSGTDLKKS